uniref:Uncharacterized protein n=1 Tax=Myotis myotis TaxID=51298 RepID=A0A7J7Z516_MYOMY|nr:hypothetical protein mMyoMyo1_010566 [Myotis myotis]
MGRLWCHPLSRTQQGPSGRLGLCTLSCTEQGPSGGWGVPPCHSQSRADRGVGAPSPVTHRAGRIRGLGRRPLSPTEQGQSGGWGATTVKLRAGLMGRLWLYPVTHRAGPVGRGGLGYRTLSHTEQGQSGGLGAAPCHADPSAGRHITLLLYRIEAWCMGGGRLVCPEGCPGSGWGSPLGCLASLGEGLRAVCSWSHTLQGGGPHWGAWPAWVRG